MTEFVIGRKTSPSGLSSQHYENCCFSDIIINIVIYSDKKKINICFTFTKQFEIKWWSSLSGQDSGDFLTYAPSRNLSGCNPHYTADKFRQVLQNQWMVKSFLDSNLGLGEKSSQEKIAIRKPPFTSQQMRQKSVLPEGLILAIRRHLFCRRRPHIKVGDCFLDLCSHDVRGCMRWTDLVKCCLALISLNDLASAARMRSCGCGNPCRKSLLGPPRSLKWPRTLFLVIPRHLASNIGVSNAANYWPGGPNTSLRWTSRLFQPGQKITWGPSEADRALNMQRKLGWKMTRWQGCK